MVVKRKNVNRVFRNDDRGMTAAKTIGDIYEGCEICGLTKGDFSMIDIIMHLVSQVGECDLTIGTWTAAKLDISKAEKVFNSDKIKSLRFLVDRSFPARQPGYFNLLLEKFGKNSVRLARFHAKFAIIQNDKWNICLRTSMNLNMNKRIELFEISDSPELCEYFNGIADHHFSHDLEDSYSAFKNVKFDEKHKSDKIKKKPSNDAGLWSHVGK